MLLVNIKTEDGECHRVLCKEEEQIATIQDKLKLKVPQVFIFNSMILSKTFPFSFYRIKNGSNIYLVNHGNMIIERLARKMIQIKNENERNQIEAIKIETIRMKDFLMKKIESTCNQNRKMLRRFKQHLNNTEELRNSLNQPREKTVIPTIASGPSADILPCFWEIPDTSEVLA